MVSNKKKNFRQDIIEAIENIDSEKEILNLHEILNEISEKTGIDLSTIRKNKEYYQLCIDGFKKHICNQFSDSFNNKGFLNENSEDRLLIKKENKMLKEKVNILEIALSKKMNAPDLDNLKILRDDIISFFKDDQKFLIKDDKVFYGKTMVVKNPIIKLVMKKG